MGWGKHAWAFALWFGLVACGDTGDDGPDDDDTSGSSTGSSAGPEPDCTVVAEPVDGSGGCRLRLVSPTNCAVVDASSGFIELAWSTQQTFCEGPHRVLILGHPATTWEQDNGYSLSLTSTGGNERGLGDNGSSYAMTRESGGVIRLSVRDLEGITTTTGQYHFLVLGFYDLDNGGSMSGTSTFSLAK